MPLAVSPPRRRSSKCMPYHLNESKERAIKASPFPSHKYGRIHQRISLTTLFLHPHQPPSPLSCKEGIIFGELASYHTQKECGKVRSLAKEMPRVGLIFIKLRKLLIREEEKLILWLNAVSKKIYFMVSTNEPFPLLWPWRPYLCREEINGIEIQRSAPYYCSWCDRNRN